MPEIIPDQVVLHEDGTVTLSFPSTPVDLDDRSKGLWVPAWSIARPVFRDVRELQSLFNQLSKERELALKATSEEQQRARAAIEAGDVDASDVADDALLEAAEQLETTVANVLWGWFQAVLARLGTPLVPFPRQPDVYDGPPWLTQTASLYHTLNAHWMAVPLVRGPGETKPTPPQLPQVPIARRPSAS